MSYNLNSLKGAIWGTIYGTTIGVIRGDTRSLDYSSTSCSNPTPCFLAGTINTESGQTSQRCASYMGLGFRP